MLAVTSN